MTDTKTPILHQIYDIKDAAYRTMRSLRAVALHPVSMRDLMLELTGLGIDYRRVVDGPFVELPGIPGPAIMLQSPGGPVRVHACRDVKDGTISAFMDERGAAWETGPLR